MTTPGIWGMLFLVLCHKVCKMSEVPYIITYNTSLHLAVQLALFCYTTWPKVCGNLLVERLIPKSSAYGVGPSLFCYNSLLGRLSTTCWNIAERTHFHSATSALVRSDVGWLGLARSLRSYLSQTYSMELRSGLCALQSSSSTLILTNYFCIPVHCHAEIGKGLPQS